jgi:hypothetical protein
LALLQLGKGSSAPQISKVLPLTSQAIRTIGHRYQHGGLESRCSISSVPALPPCSTTAQKQRIVAMICSNPPEGRARWTVRLVAQEVGPTGGVLLPDHDLKLWPKNGVRRRTQPVVCLDEKPVTLQADVRPTFPAKPAREARRDNEYERRGTNVFCGVALKAGLHFTLATPDRSGFEFARVACELAMQYRDAKTVHWCWITSTRTTPNLS